MAGRETVAVVGHGQRQRAVVARERQVGLGGAGVARDVRQRLLGHAVQDELVVRRQVGQLVGDLLAHGQAGALGEPFAQDGERALESEVVERLGSQLDRDPPYILEAAAHGALDLGDVVAQLAWDPRLDTRQSEQHRGELLPDLVVQLLRDPQALGFLAGEDPPGGIPALGLEAGEHLVERRGQLARLGCRVRNRHPLGGVGEIDPPGQGGQRFDGAHRGGGPGTR